MTNNEPAAHLRRLLAAFTDIIILIPLISAAVLLVNEILSLPVTPSFSLYGFEVEMNSWAQQHFWELVLLYSSIKLIILAPYFILLECSGWQGTPGKKLLQLKVADYQGKRITLKQSLIRFFSKILSAQLLIGYLMILFHPRRQGLHDLIAKTRVYKSP